MTEQQRQVGTVAHPTSERSIEVFFNERGDVGVTVSFRIPFTFRVDPANARDLAALLVKAADQADEAISLKA